ncbi:MAG: polysaccharide biosynthesis protein [Clostridia bacterium]|nr:polysaccharide biosynthesis protein [Clostridia bacterium]
MNERKQGTFFGGTLLLMLAGVLVKLIGAFFSIPLANLYGADGNDIFISAYYVYTAMYVVSSAGLPVAVSKMVAEARALGRGGEVRRIARLTFATFLLIGAVLSAAMMLSVDVICRFIGSSCRYAVLAVAPTVFFTCVVSAVRGYYQGMANMVPTAVSQVIEALGKLIFGLGLAWYLTRADYSLEIVVAGAIGGVTLGTVFSALYMLLYRLRDRRRFPMPEKSGECRSDGELLRTLVRLAVPITIGASVFSVSTLIDTFMVKLRLQEKCFMTDAAAGYLYGAYGFAVKLFNLPLTLVVAIGVSLIPAISGALALRQKEKTLRLTESAFRLTGILAFPCAVGLAVIPLPILKVLFPTQPEACAVAAPLLTLLAPSVFLAAMVSVSNPVLQAMGRVKLPVFAMLAGAVVKIAANYVLVGIPGIGICGAPIGTGLCYLTILCINLWNIRRLKVDFSLRRVFLRPLLAAGVMGAFVWLIYSPLVAMLQGGGLWPLAAVLLTVGLAALLYVGLLVALRAMPKEDVLMLPKGEKIAKFLRIP